MKHLSCLILILHLCNSCSSIRPVKPLALVTVDEHLAPYAEVFFKDFGINAASVSMTFGAQEDETFAASCYRWRYEDGRIASAEIIVDTWIWSRLGKIQREALMYHELLHCTINAEHNDAIDLTTECPLSIMHPMVLSTRCYEAYKDKYVKEFSL